MNNFDWKFYLNTYPDLIKNNLNNEKCARWHYFKYGIHEGRAPNANYIKNNIENTKNIIEEEERNIELNKINNKKEINLFNILIRTSSRPTYFDKCIKSILMQEYKNYRIIVCYDNEDSRLYIEKYKKYIKSKFSYFFIEKELRENKEKYKFNLYCNSLLDKVKDGYIIFLDDDDKFTQKYSLNIINNNIKSEDYFYIWKFLRSDKVIYPEDINNIKLGEIDTTSACFHSKYKDIAKWWDKQYGDFNFYNQLLTNTDIKLNKIFINNILTQMSVNNENIGNFGNSENKIIDHSILLEENGINMFNNILDNNKLDSIYKNIDHFSSYLNNYKNILFLCSDYPGYGGAATNCFKLSKYYEKTHNIYSIYWNYENEINKNSEKGNNYQIVNQNKLENTLKTINFSPDIIILKNAIHIDLYTIFKCPIIFLIPGIYYNNLDKYYKELTTIEEHNKYINKGIINQIKNSTYSFCNSSHTRDILKNIYKLKTYIFYSSFVPFYGKKIKADINFNERKYEYGLIVSNFDRNIKNIEKSINFLKDKENVILIGKGSSKYKDYSIVNSFEYIENIDYTEIIKYYKQIKYIQQDSFYESCSNVKIEGLFNGCKLKPTIVISSTQYPGYGGAATNAYELIKEFRIQNYNVCGVFFNNDLNVCVDPDNIGGIYLYTYKYDKYEVIQNVYKYLKTYPNICLAKNYLAPELCKDIFKCYTVYLVSGINHFRLYYSDKCAQELLDKNFIIDKKFDQEIKTINIVDKIIINSEITKNIFLKIYPDISYKIYNVFDTTIYIKKTPLISKINDIIIVCSRLTRKDKNNIFLIDVLKDSKFDRYSKIIIGENNSEFINIINSKCLGLCNHTDTIYNMNKSKILLFPSLFDSNSNTVREAYYHKCLPLITKNIGFFELYPDYLVCNSFDKNEWINKILYLLENYEDVKNTKINYNEKLNLEELIN